MFKVFPFVSQTIGVLDSQTKKDISCFLYENVLQKALVYSFFFGLNSLVDFLSPVALVETCFSIKDFEFVMEYFENAVNVRRH